MVIVVDHPHVAMAVGLLLVGFVAHGIRDPSMLEALKAKALASIDEPGGLRC
ncbi:MAG TPA: hypothetical protein VIM98_19840 [Dyella sp.]|uniref:hypothetical protein n=1 Tax=Dyella sp. TaxID=1869338 RepID=UPI002F926347